MAQKLKNLPAGDLDLIPGLGISPGEGNGNPSVFLPEEFQQATEIQTEATVHGVTKSRT